MDPAVCTAVHWSAGTPAPCPGCQVPAAQAAHAAADQPPPWRPRGPGDPPPRARGGGPLGGRGPRTMGSVEEAGTVGYQGLPVPLPVPAGRCCRCSVSAAAPPAGVAAAEGLAAPRPRRRARRTPVPAEGLSEGSLGPRARFALGTGIGTPGTARSFPFCLPFCPTPTSSESLCTSPAGRISSCACCPGDLPHLWTSTTLSG